MGIIAVDTNTDTGITVEKTLFGHNLEHTRSAVFQGLSAQILRNRKFAGKPAAHFGEAAEWYRIGAGNVYIALDPVDAYVRHVQSSSGGDNEINSLVIQNPAAGQRAGIGQKDLPLQKGKEYRVKTVLKGRGPFPFGFTVRIVNAARSPCAEKSFVISEEGWQPYVFTFIMPEDDMNAALEISFTERAEIKTGVVSLLPTNAFHGMRRDVIDLMKEMGISLLRWPGGNFAGEYNWQDGLLDVDMRAPQLSYQPIETQPHSGGYDFHEIGTDEFIALCREIGAESYVTINLARNSPEESAQWVEYCNGNSDTEWGRKRAERGFPEPYHVRYWSLGNEFGYGHMEGLNTPEDYAEKAMLSAAAMKRVDDSLLLFASGPYTLNSNSEPWTKKVLPVLAGHIFCVSYHAYQGLFVHGVDFVTDSGIRASYEDVCGAPDVWLEDLRKLRAGLGSGEDSVRKVGISFDEWNVFFAWYHNPCVIEGMFTALMLDMICREHIRLNMPVCMYFQPVNEGAILVFPFGSELTANGQVFALMKEHSGGTLISVACDDRELRCLGTIHRGDNRAVVTLINRAYDRAIPCSFEPGLPIGQAMLLDGTGPLFPGSRFRKTDGMKIKEADGTFIIPPRSIWQADIRRTEAQSASGMDGPDPGRGDQEDNP
jgi:alpha-N-arabinofuranosidase